MVSKPQFGTITKKHGAWHWRYYENGKQKSVKLAEVSDEFRAKKDVVSLANDRAAQLTPHQPVSGNVSVVGFAEKEYFPWLKEQRRAATVDGYDKIWRGHLQKHFAAMRLSEYRPHHASNFLTALAKGSMGRHSVSHVRSVMSAIFKHAIAKGRLVSNPIHGAALLATPKAPKNTGAYTAEEVIAIMAALADAPQASLAVALGFFLGLRTAEISGLQWSDISEDWNTIHIQRSVWRGKTSPCKTEHSAAVLPLIEPLRSMLIEFKAESTIVSPNQFILINGNLAPLDLHAMTRRTIRPKLKAKKVAWRGYYAGRRGLSTLLANTDPMAAMGMLRHKSLNTTQEFYIKTIPAVTLSAMKQLEASSTSARDNKVQSLEEESVSTL